MQNLTLAIQKIAYIFDSAPRAMPQANIGFSHIFLCKEIAIPKGFDFIILRGRCDGIGCLRALAAQCRLFQTIGGVKLLLHCADGCQLCGAVPCNIALLYEITDGLQNTRPVPQGNENAPILHFHFTPDGQSFSVFQNRIIF